MKRKKAQVEKASVGTVVGAKYRARCNDLSDSEREKLNDEFLKLKSFDLPALVIASPGEVVRKFFRR